MLIHDLGRDTSGRPLRVDDRTLRKLRRAEAALGHRFVVVQGSYRGGAGAAASAGTHDRGGVIDLRTWDLPTHISPQQAVRVLRESGLIAWYRTKAQGFDPHIHAIDYGNPDLAPSAARQVTAWQRGRNGLASNGPDDGARVSIPKRPPTIHRAAAWNLRVGRKPAVVVREVKALLHDERLDVLAVQEAAGYLRALRADKQLMRDYRVVGYPKRGASARDSAMIVRRRGHKIKGRRLHKMGGIRWERQPGRKGLHRPRRMVSVLVDGIRYASPHAPPGPRGPRYPLRAKAGRRFNRRLAKVTGRWTKRGRAWVAAGDYNDLPTSVGSAASPTPAWAARQTGARITGTGIDYVLSHGVRITDYRRGDAQGSDHRPILYTVTKER